MLYLKELAQQGRKKQSLSLVERLPTFINSPCVIDVSYQVESREDYFVLDLQVAGKITIICQRCMHEFELLYDNHTALAICRTEERAEKLLTHYECIVSENSQVDLEDLITDELHLYVPQFHLEISECDREINQILTERKDYL